VYYYRIWEDTAGQTTGWSYSGNVYIATVSVPLVGDPTVTYSLLEGTPDEGTYNAGPGSDGYVGFINTYEAPEYEVEIELTKTGPVNIALNQFTFDLWESDDEGTFVGMLPKASGTSPAGNPVQVTIPQIFYEAHVADDYAYYILRENVSGNANGWSIDHKQYWIRVHVNGTGVDMTDHTIEYQIGEPGDWDDDWKEWDGDTYKFTFDNKLKTKIELEKSGKEKGGSTPVALPIAGQFTFDLYKSDDSTGTNLTAFKTATNMPGTPVTVVFDEWEITSTDTKYYVLKESEILTPPNVNWTTDPKEYLIEISVSGDPLRSVIKYQESTPTGWDGSWKLWDGGTNKFSFENLYDKPTTAFEPKVTKNSTGKKLSEGLFEFKLFEVTGPESGHTVTSTVVRTKTNAASSESAPGPYTAVVLFPAISYGLSDKNQTYYYLLKETSEHLNGWEINVGNRCWMFKVEVIENPDSSLKAEAYIRAANADGTYPAGSSWAEYKPNDDGTLPWFDNAFTPVNVVIQGKKTVTEDVGATAPDEVFDFEIVACDSTGKPLTGAVTFPMTARGGEIFTFDVNGLEPGPQPYYFRISEKWPSPIPDDGWEYSGNVYRVTITVPEVVVGGVTHTVTYTRIEGNDTPLDEAEFKNNYSAGKLTLIKEVAGSGADQDKPFNFTVEFSEDVTYNGVTGKTHTVPLSHNGPPAVFTNIPYGTTYTITEADYVPDGYLGSVTIGNATGTISSSNAAATVTFTNTYVGIKVNLEGLKTTVGGTMTAGQFQFLWQTADVAGNAMDAGVLCGDIQAGTSSPITFPTQTYTAATDANYLITEQLYTVNDGWVSDTREYHVWVHVTGTDTLVPEVKVRTRESSSDDWSDWEDYESPADISFANYYGTPFEFTKTDRDGIPFGKDQAVFELYKCTNPAHIQPEDHSDVSDNDYGCWDVDHPLYRVATDTDGLVRFDLLTNGHYLLAEVKTKSGYQLPHGQWLLVVNVSANPKVMILGHGEQLPPAFRTENEKLLLPNYPQFTPPHAGSVSALLYPAAGTALVLLASYFGISTSRRRRKRLSA